MTTSRDDTHSRRILVLGLLLFVAALNFTVLVVNTTRDDFGGDFRQQYYVSASDVVHGLPVYVDVDDARLARALDGVLAYPYPPLVAVAFTPVTALSVDHATMLVFLAAVASILGALWIVGVRDVRCYLVSFAWPPIWNGLDVLNLSCFLALGVALAWRFRDSLWPFALALGLSMAAKIFLWPVLVWTLAARRTKQALLAVLVAVVATVGPWAVIGFQGFVEYPSLLRKLADVNAGESYSIEGMTTALGLPSDLGRALSVALGAALIALAWRACRRGEEEIGFAYAIVAALALSPIVWQHYLLLLLAPLGVLRPRLSAIWLVPMLAWLSPRFGNGDGLEPFLPAVVVVVFLAALVWRPSESPREVRTT